MDGYTIGMTMGIIIGIAIGASIGISIGKNQKPWSELTYEEKAHKKVIIIFGFIILLIGFILNIWLFFKW